MHDDNEIRALLHRIIREEKINVVIESGTYDGLGSTTFVAESFPKYSPPISFITIEANWKVWKRAKRNLSRFNFIKPIWGYSISIKEALRFIQQDDCLRNHKDYDNIFIDDIVDPIAFYSNEILAKDKWNLFSLFNISRKQISKVFYHKGDNLLIHYLREYRDTKPLIVLDSAGGVGFLEFSILLKEMSSVPYLLMLDDILHIKHFRSYMHIQSDPSFTIISFNEQSGWLLAKHN